MAALCSTLVEKVIPSLVIHGILHMLLHLLDLVIHGILHMHMLSHQLDFIPNICSVCCSAMHT